MDACCVEVDIDFDDHLNPSNMRFSVFVGLVGEGASRIVQSRGVPRSYVHQLVKPDAVLYLLSVCPVL